MDLVELIKVLHNIGDQFNIDQTISVLVNDKEISNVKLINNKVILILEND